VKLKMRYVNVVSVSLSVAR